jgi:phage-related protein
MSQRLWKTIYYEKPNGRCPVVDFLSSRNAEENVYIENEIERLEQYGDKHGRPYIGYLRDKIWELRVKVNRSQFRIFFFFFEGNKIVMTHGYLKKTRKVPDSEIDKAIEYRNDYISSRR